MDYWNNIIDSHTVKLFRNILYDYCGIDVHFYDKYGNCKNNGNPFRNTLCSLKISNSQTEEYILNLMKLAAEDVVAFYKTFNEKKETKEKQALFKDRSYKEKYKCIIGKSASMKIILDTLDLIENSESPVLIEGESGTGKELLASAIHYNSSRKDRAFIIQNCSAFSDSLLSTELFGHEKGSFTGAVLEKKGLFEIADGGTLFLDEIGDMNIEVQGKLLRVLENGTFYRVGGTEEKKIDVRIITASNKDLTKQVEKDLFRKDLFYRINTLNISVPPLRNRKEDILPLFFHFIEHYTDKKNIGEKEISPALIDLLVNHNWPGNVRELKNVVDSLLTLSGGSKTIEPKHLSTDLIQTAYIEPSIRDHKGGKKLLDILKSIEKEITEKVLQRAKWNKTVASRELGISRSSLNRRIEKFNIRQKSP